MQKEYRMRASGDVKIDRVRAGDYPVAPDWKSTQCILAQSKCRTTREGDTAAEHEQSHNEDWHRHRA